MKKIALILSLALLALGLAGCGETANDSDSDSAADIVMPAQIVEQPGLSTRSATVAEEPAASTTKHYASKELNIGFDYPASWGETKEINYKNIELHGVKFSNGIEMLPIDDEGFSGRGVSCTDIIKTSTKLDRPASDCKAVALGGNTGLQSFVYTLASMSGTGTRVLQFSTAKGPWGINNYTPVAGYEDEISIVMKSFKVGGR